MYSPYPLFPVFHSTSTSLLFIIHYLLCQLSQHCNMKIQLVFWEIPQFHIAHIWMKPDRSLLKFDINLNSNMTLWGTSYKIEHRFLTFIIFVIFLRFCQFIHSHSFLFVIKYYSYILCVCNLWKRILRKAPKVNETQTHKLVSCNFHSYP